MRVFSKKKLREFWERHPDAKEPLLRWYKATGTADWRNLADTRRDFPHADAVGTCTVFNIAGNKYRLIAYIVYPIRYVYVLHILTHAGYDTEAWKKDCGC